MKNLLITILLIFLCSCATSSEVKNTYVLKYEDFGPPSLASELIGMDWWQWQSHGDPRPKEYDIKVVIYKSIDLNKVKNMYPVSPKDWQDFRYLEYRDALDFLDNAIKENLINQLTQTLIETKQKIQTNLNDVSKDK